MGLQLMMRPALVQVPRLALTHEAMFQTIFTLTEAYLRESEHIKALRVLARNKRTEKYRCIIDFIWAETFRGGERRACFAYYAGHGKLAKDIYSKARVRWYDHCCLGVCVQAYEAFCEERRVSWANAAAAGRAMMLSPRPE